VHAAEDGDYDAAVNRALGAGIDELKLSLDWNRIEAGGAPDWTVPDIAEAYYPAKGIPLTLVLRPLDADRDTYPPDLSGRPPSDSLVVSRFLRFLDGLRARMPRVAVRRMCIGNEVDGGLGTDPEKWREFGVFFGAASRRAKALWGSGLPVSAVVMAGGLRDPAVAALYQDLCRDADFHALTYYPLNGDFSVKDPSWVRTDFRGFASGFGSKPVVLVECGCPSGAGCGSSEEIQRRFVAETFTAWDEHAGSISHVDFTWMNDITPEEADRLTALYGLSGSHAGPAFREYLLTLGLRTHGGGGSDKPAFVQFMKEAAARGWGGN
jgi:hypothetical protein